MGIPKFYGEWISTHIRNSIDQSKRNYSSLSFDLNGLLHSARKTVFESQTATGTRLIAEKYAKDPDLFKNAFFTEIGNSIVKTVEYFSPKDTLILAIDGIAPAAKMQQQRARRERAAKEGFSAFDRNALTPGTDIMIEIESYLEIFIQKYRSKFPLTVIYSGHLTPGEGEHKIMEYYRSGIMKEGNHVIYGLDADLILLSLVSPLSNIYLSRENFDNVVIIDEIKQYLLTFGQRAIHDFTIMMSLIGNDFLPHIPTMDQLSSSIDLMLNIYKNGNFNFTNDDFKIDWAQFGLFLQELTTHDNELYVALVIKQSSLLHPSTIVSKSIFDGGFSPDKFRTFWYSRALSPRENNTTDQLNLLFGNIFDVNERLITMIESYCKTVAWVYLYYSKGQKYVSQSWAYPYYYSPLVSEISLMCQAENLETLINGYSITQFEDVFPTQEFTVIHQLLSVLPKKSSNLIPNQYRNLVTDYSMLADLYPDQFIDELDGTDIEHLSIPIIPIIAGNSVRQRIIDAVSSIPVNYAIAQQWEKKEPTIDILSEEDQILIYSKKNRTVGFVSRNQGQIRDSSSGRGRGRGRGRGGASTSYRQQNVTEEKTERVNSGQRIIQVNPIKVTYNIAAPKITVPVQNNNQIDSSLLDLM